MLVVWCNKDTEFWILQPLLLTWIARDYLLKRLVWRVKFISFGKVLFHLRVAGKKDRFLDHLEGIDWSSWSLLCWRKCLQGGEPFLSRECYRWRSTRSDEVIPLTIDNSRNNCLCPHRWRWNRMFLFLLPPTVSPKFPPLVRSSVEFSSPLPPVSRDPFECTDQWCHRRSTDHPEEETRQCSTLYNRWENRLQLDEEEGRSRETGMSFVLLHRRQFIRGRINWKNWASSGEPSIIERFSREDLSAQSREKRERRESYSVMSLCIRAIRFVPVSIVENVRECIHRLDRRTPGFYWPSLPSFTRNAPLAFSNSNLRRLSTTNFAHESTRTERERTAVSLWVHRQSDEDHFFFFLFLFSEVLFSKDKVHNGEQKEREDSRRLWPEFESPWRSSKHIQEERTKLE